MAQVKTTQRIGFKRNLSLLLIIGLFIVLSFACNSNPTLVEDSKKQADYDTDELFLWKKPLVNGVYFSEHTTIEDELFYYDKIHGTFHRLNISNGKTELVGIDKKPLPLFGGRTFYPQETSIIRYYTSKDHEDRRVILEKVSLPDMQIQWQHIMDRPRSLIIYKNLVLYGSFSGFIYSLNIEDGTLRWRFSFEEAVGKGFYPHQYEEDTKDPISLDSDLYINGDTLYCYYNGVKENQGRNKGLLYAINLSTQQLKWKLLTNGEIIREIFFDEKPQEKKLIFVTYTRNLDDESSKVHILSTIYIVNKDTGLAEQMDVSYQEIASGRSLVNVSDELFIVSASGEDPLGAISRKDTSQQIWETADSKYWTGSIVANPSFIYTIHQVSPSSHEMKYELIMLVDFDSMKIQIVELEYGQHIATWALNAKLYHTPVSLARANTLAIVSDKKGIYALDLEKVLTRWLETKETIEIVTGNE
jgi:hypothetical protein